MPSFDIVSEFDKHEVTNAVDQANREVDTRFDFKGSDCQYTFQGNEIKLKAEADFQLKQMIDILSTKLTKRGVDIQHMEIQDPVIQHKSATQNIVMQSGISADSAKKIVKLIKDGKLKVQAAIQGDQVRVTGKKRDDLQSVMAMLKAEDLKVPLSFTNFRD